MNTKELITAEIAKVVPELEQENIQNLLETPKNADMGDLAFPAFSLAKVLRKAPQMIAADIAEKIDASNFEKVEAVGPYINFFLDKSKISAQVIKEIVKEGIKEVVITGIHVASYGKDLKEDIGLIDLLEKIKKIGFVLINC